MKNKINPGISSGMRFRELRAANWAGATLDELFKWENNEYSPKFKALIVALYNMAHLVDAHVEDEKAKKIERS